MLFKTKVFIFFSVGFSILFVFGINELGAPRLQRPSRGNISTTYNETIRHEKKPKVRVLVLAYTVFFGIKEWVPVPESCPEYPCKYSFEVTYDKKRFSESDFVLFHARDMPHVDHLKSLSKSRPRNLSQWWIYHLMESPNATPNPEPLNGLFNLTSTYRSDSDIGARYGAYAKISNLTNAVSVQDFAQGKSKLVSWKVSNCGPALRKQFTHQLQKYVQVDVFGSCSGEFGGSKSCSEKDWCRTTMKQYKFYLAFENALCEDYITEKYWFHLEEENIVPVVMGGANYSKLAIPGSYIDVMDFKTVKELAEYLQYLDKNNTAYNEYFTWRRTYRPVLEVPWLCKLCKVLSMETPLKPKVYDNLKDFWVKQGKCNEKDQIVKNIWQS